jgi:hypothetical protein
MKEPFDPWVEVNGADTVLRSVSLDGLSSAIQVRDCAIALIDRLNGVLALSGQAKPVRFGGVIQFAPDGGMHRTIFAEIFEDLDVTMSATVTVFGGDGKPVPSPPPQPSQVQEWTLLAEREDLLDDALIYFGRATDWFNIYKTLECLILRFGGGRERDFLLLGWASEAEITRLKRTANAARHAKRQFGCRNWRPIWSAGGWP